MKKIKKQFVLISAVLVIGFVFCGSVSAEDIEYVYVGSDQPNVNVDGIPYYMIQDSNGYPVQMISTSGPYSVPIDNIVANEIHILQTSGISNNFPDGTKTGEIVVNYSDGTSQSLDLILGVNTAEWAYDRPGLYVAHTKIEPAYSFWNNIDSSRWYWGHLFYVSITPQQKPITSISIVPSTAASLVYSITLEVSPQNESEEIEIPKEGQEAAAESVPMQPTGTPLLPALISALMVSGGILASKRYKF